MNIAIIFAGGTGSRMNTKSKPKQFLEVHGKAVLVYTLEHFQKHDAVDEIVLVCLKSWISYTKDLVDKYGLSKVVTIVPGGNNGQESIYNGLEWIAKNKSGDHVVLIHDGVRPLINEQVITECIGSVKLYGNGITISPAIETIFIKENNGRSVGEILERNRCELAKAPQCFLFNQIYEAHVQARKDKLLDFIDSASLMQYYGYKLFTIVGPAENIKITTPSDFYVFRAILDARENMQVLGL